MNKTKHPSAHKQTVQNWVDYIQTLHARSIDLSLERVSKVYQTLYPQGVPYAVISIAGTNGKGSTAELLASIYKAAGYCVGKYTSPHLVSFSERFLINKRPISEADLLAAFERIEFARGNVPLTFFEFGTLLAIDYFARETVDIAVMEVGLGGRLDAVNILRPDITVITNVAMDHTAWLGDSLAAIAREKFGITRAGIPCVIGMHNPPKSMLELAKDKSVPLLRVGRDFSAMVNSKSNTWDYQNPSLQLQNLPLPFSQAGHQINNAAAALTVIDALENEFAVNRQQIRQGLAGAYNPARCEIVQHDPAVIIDVAHNEASVAALVEFVKTLSPRFPKARIIAVCGMLKDKEIAAALGHIAPCTDQWYLASIDDERGSTAAEIAAILNSLDQPLDAESVHLYEHASAAFDQAVNSANKRDIIVVFGSFFICGDIIKLFQKSESQMRETASLV